MNPTFFTSTKKKLYELSDELNLKFIHWFQKEDPIWELSISQDNKILKYQCSLIFILIYINS